MMIKTIALVVTIFNPANDTTQDVSFGPYVLGECLTHESNMYKSDSPVMIELKKRKLELVESKCE